MTMAVATCSVATLMSCHESTVSQQVQQTDDELLFAQAQMELQDQELLEEQVQQYRLELYVQTYLNQMLQLKADAVTDEECREFFDRYGKDLKLEEPIVKGLLIKLPAQNQKNPRLHGWLTSLSQGKEDDLVALENYCEQRAAVYDNFSNQWVRLSRLTDQLPITVVEPRQFLAIKAYELTDSDYDYYFVVTDYRLDGEHQPYEWARSGIIDLLVQQKRENFRRELVEGIKAKNKQ